MPLQNLYTFAIQLLAAIKVFLINVYLSIYLPVMDKVKSVRKASGKNKKGKGTNQRKKPKVVATNKEPNV